MPKKACLSIDRSLVGKAAKKQVSYSLFHYFFPRNGIGYQQVEVIGIGRRSNHGSNLQGSHHDSLSYPLHPYACIE
jgi:hypothetical protein